MNFKLSKNTVSPELARIIQIAKRPIALFQAGAKAVQKQISDHLRRLQERGNKMGWPSQKFFAGKATSVERKVGISSLSDKGATVTIADPRFIHHITGGTVTPKRAKNIALPLTAEAYAASGKGSIKESMPGLKVVKLPTGLFLVKERAGNRDAQGKFLKGAAKTITIVPMFKLVRRVRHNPHPEAMPDVNQLSTAARDAMFQAAKILFKAS